MIAGMYLVASVIGHLIKTRGKVTNDHSVEIYIQTNGAHTDFILPVQNEIMNWSTFLSEQSSKNPNASFVGVGWGDKGFYLDTPEWKDLKFSTAVKALFGFSHTLMHITFYEKIEASNQCVKLKLSTEQYKILVAYVLDYFQLSHDKKPFIVPDSGYGDNDEFYEAHQKYTLFKTCNVWTNQGLKKMGIKTAIWAPFERTVMKNVKEFSHDQSIK